MIPIMTFWKTQNSTVVTRGKGEWRDIEKGKWGQIHSDGKRCDFGW